MVNGGGTIYERALDARGRPRPHPRPPRRSLSDTFFPPIDPSVWKESLAEDHDGFSFVTYERA